MTVSSLTNILFRVFLSVGGLACVCCADVSRADTDLDAARTRHLPYRIKLDSLNESGLALDRGWCRPYVVTTLGQTEVVFSARNPGIVRADESPGFYSVRWQHSLPPEYCHRTPCASLDGLWDVDGDGDEELVLISPTADRSRWLLQSLDVEDGSVVTGTVIAGGPDRRADGRWDGVYSVVGAIDVPSGPTTRRALVVAAEAGFDLAPRGVMAIDPGTGEVLWTHWAGAKPTPDRVCCADLDADGSAEVVYLGSVVNNLDSAVAGLGDDICTLVCVDSAGRRRWVTPLPENVSGFLRDVTTTRGSFLVAAVSGVPGRPSRVFVIAGDTGTVVASADLEGLTHGLACEPRDESIDIYVGDDGIGVVRYRFDGTLVREAAARSASPLDLLGLGELLRGRDRQVFAGARDGSIFVLDRDLRLLADFADAPKPACAGGVIVRPRAGREPVLQVLGHELAAGFILAVEPNPRPIPWGALSLLPIAGGTGWYVRRRRRGASAATVRELRLQLLSRLELSNHGAIGALRSLRRLVWILDALAQAEGGSADLEARLVELKTECGDHMLPELAGTLELAGLARCDATVVGQARGAHGRITRLLDAGDGDERQNEMRDAAALLEGALMTLRRALEDAVRADLSAVVDRVLKAHEPAITAAGVQVEVNGLDAPVWCRVDQDELVFVVDNLVENAVRAMGASARRTLTLTALRADGQILLQVKDTGCGIAPDDWEAVLETRKSERKSGGLGLPESRRRLRKHGGSLAITASEAGTGTTLLMSVAPARAQESVTDH